MKKTFKTGRRDERRMHRRIDDLIAFEEFQEEILPALRMALKEGKSAEEIYKMATAAAAARVVTIAVKEQDSSKALAAAKEILDRDGGKAVERKEVKHKYSELKDDELDALLLSETTTTTPGSSEDTQH
jgi:hypothetical protein